MKRSITGVIILVFALFTNSFGQGSITGVPFVQLGSSAYSLSLGEATVALGNYPGSTHYNPAGTGEMRMLQTGTFFHAQNRITLEREIIVEGFGLANPYVSYKNNDWAYSLSFKYFDWPVQVRTDETGMRLGEVNSYEYTAGFSVSYDLSETISLGAGFNYIFSKLGAIQVGGEKIEKAQTFSLDVGALYKNTVQLSDEIIMKPSAGISLSDFGPSIKYTENSPGDPLPMTLRAGLAGTFQSTRKFYGQPYLSITLARALSKIMARKEDGGSPHGPFRALFSSWDTYQFFNGQQTESYPLKEQINVHTGIEISVLSTLMFRLGREYLPPVNGASYHSIGGGVDLFYVRIDYTHLNFNNGFFRDVSAWQLTGQIPIGGERPKIISKLLGF